MKRSQNSLSSVSVSSLALAFFALLGLTACPQDAKEEGKATPTDPAAAPAQPTTPVVPATDPAAAAAPTAPPAAAAVNPTAAPAPGEALKADPSKAAAGDPKAASAK